MNTQQPQTEFYGAGFAGPLSHSPNPTRQGYATAVGLPSALNGGRRSQQSGADLGSLPSAASLFADDRFASFEPGQRFDRNSTPAQPGLQAVPAYSMFSAPNQTAWNYNGAGSAATLSGPMSGPLNDGSRLRPNNRRAPLHPEWTTNNDSPLSAHSNHGLYYPTQQHLIGTQTMGMPSAGSPDPYSASPSINMHPYGPPEIRPMPDSRKDMGDLIPTAIVIKNIPFNVRKEYLTQVMVELQLPQPYAFNYHFDQGVFRGLAFANFQSPTDTKMVIDRMNGLEIHGRKLRVEYKKMLPEHERERIEREKREKRGQLEEQHRGPAHQLSMSSIATASSVQRSQVNDRMSARPIDMNDRHTLNFYVDLYMFKTDDSREVMIYPATVPPEDRRLIHTLAHNMGLEHQSIGEGEGRQVHVAKVKFASNSQQSSSAQQPGVPLDGHPRGLSRAATYDFNDRQHPSIHSIARGPTLAIPGSPDNASQHGINNLRGVKSFADLRSFSPSPSTSHTSAAMGAVNLPTNGHSAGNVPYISHFPSDSPFGPSLVTPSTPGSSINPPSSSLDASSLVNGLGSLNLGSSSLDGSMSLNGRPRETPGAIGSQRPSANGNGSRAANPERQPRGPDSDWENPTGFSRGRANGHMQHGSDSSENTGRIGASSHSSGLY